MKSMSYTFLDTPIGRLRLEGDEEALRGIAFEGEPGPARPEAVPTDTADGPAPLACAAAQLGAFFRGELRAFDLPVGPAGTPFQRRVWALLQEIPFGRTVTYGELAARLGAPGSARAVGAACGRNPIPIVIPCHRVIGGRGRLTGYRGGLEIKRKLLDLENARST